MGGKEQSDFFGIERGFAKSLSTGLCLSTAFADISRLLVLLAGNLEFPYLAHGLQWRDCMLR